MTAPVPRYFLYGEPCRDVELDFLHVERIASRSRIHDWMIRPHAHPDQHQLLFLSAGRADISIETAAFHEDAPALVVVPALSVHAFAFRPESDGFVLTASRAYVHESVAGDPDLEPLFDEPLCLAGAAVEPHRLQDCFEALEREFVWAARGRRTAILAEVKRIVVAVARAAGDARGRRGPLPGRDLDIVWRYRDLVERTFRDHPSMETCAARLHVTPARLNRACRAVAGTSALAVLHDRLMVEAKRGLIYTGMTIAEVGHSVGMADPAYFSRFFAVRAGCPPGEFRRHAADGGKATGPVAEREPG